MSYSPPANDAVDFTLESFTVPANDAVDFTLAEPAPGTPTPTATPAPGGARDQDLYDELVNYDERDEELLNPPNLYTDLVRDVTVSQPIALLFAGIILGFAWFAVKLRSVVVGGLWLFMALSFIMAVLVDTSLVYFWIAVALGSVGLVAAVMESSL